MSDGVAMQPGDVLLLNQAKTQLDARNPIEALKTVKHLMKIYPKHPEIKGLYVRANTELKRLRNSMDNTEAQLKLIEAQIKADLRQQQRDRFWATAYRFLRFASLILLVVEIGFVVLQVIFGNTSMFGIANLQTWALILLALIFVAVYYISDSLIAV